MKRNKSLIPVVKLDDSRTLLNRRELTSIRHVIGVPLSR